MKRKRETTQKRGEKAHKEITRQHDRDICQRWCLEYCADTIQQVDPGMLIFFNKKNTLKFTPTMCITQK